MNTDVVLRAILDRDNGLGRGGLLSNITVFESPTEKRLLFMSDPAVNISPDAARKADMLRNAIWVARRLGFSRPKVAVLAAIEKINPKDMPATADAAVMAKMGEAGQIGDADVAGPYALDIAVSAKAAKCKHIDGPVAGCADILLCPDINSANILYKSLVYFAGREIANAMIGVKTPLVMTSRSDSSLTKLYTMALSVVLAGDDRMSRTMTGRTRQAQREKTRPGDRRQSRLDLDQAGRLSRRRSAWPRKRSTIRKRSWRNSPASPINMRSAATPCCDFSPRSAWISTAAWPWPGAAG